MEFDEFLSRLHNVRRESNGQFGALCPGHDDRQNSLSLREGEKGGVVLSCKAGCATPNILAAMSLSMADIMGKPYCEAVYDYTDKTGTQVLYRVERWANPKTFKCVPSLPPPAERVLYGLPSVQWARENNRTVFVVEGEKDCHTLYGLTQPATTNVCGAQSPWLPQYTEALAGLNIVIVADNDEVGRKRARHIADQLKGMAATVTVMHSPVGKDVTDLIDAGYTIDKLQLLPEADDIGFFITSKITPRKVEWAWPRRFPLGKLSIVEGDPGDGKSLLTLDLVARWSTGTPMPDGFPTPRFNCVIVSAEDEPADTIVPRLIKAGTDRDRVAVVEYGSVVDSPLDITTDMSALRKRIIEFNAKIVVFDPITAFLSEKTDSHNDASVRRALGPLKTLAATTGAAVIVVRHLNKGGAGSKALYRGGGSIGFVGAARACHLVAQHPEEPNLRVFAPVKMNLARKPETLTYEIVEPAEGEVYIEWRGTIDLSAQAVLDGPERRPTDEDQADRAAQRIAREQEQKFLINLLEDGPQVWSEIVSAGKVAGFTEISLRRARTDVGLIQIGKAKASAWARPAVPSTTDSDDETDRAHLAQQNNALVLGPKTVSKMSTIAESSDTESSVDSDEVDRDELLQSMSLICDECQSTDPEQVRRYAHPWYVVRCFAHSPVNKGR